MADRCTKLAGMGLLGMVLAPSSAFALPWDIDLVDAYFYRAYEWSMQDLPEGVVSRHPDSVGEAGRYDQGANNAVQDGLYLDDVTQAICASSDGTTQLPDSEIALKMPSEVATDEYWSKQGAELFDVYCVTCHGADGRQGSPVVSEDIASGARFLLAEPPPLSGGCEPISGASYEVFGEDTPATFCADMGVDQASCQAQGCEWKGTGNLVPALCDAGLFSTIRNGKGGMRGYHQAMDTDEIWAVVRHVRSLPGNERN